MSKKKKKLVKFTKKSLTICKNCGKPKLKDDAAITEEQMARVNENISAHDIEGLVMK